MIERGILALIVGPSVVGKDSPIARARTLLAGDLRFRFPRRDITRPVVGDPESRIALTQSEFNTAKAYGAFLLRRRGRDQSNAQISVSTPRIASKKRRDMNRTMWLAITWWAARKASGKAKGTEKGAEVCDQQRFDGSCSNPIVLQVDLE